MPGWYFWEEFGHKQRKESQRQRRKNKCVHVYNVYRDGPIPPPGITNTDDRPKETTTCPTTRKRP